MPKTNKDEEYSISHCIQRLNERYSMSITKEEYEDWNNRIREHVKINWDVEVTKGRNKTLEQMCRISSMPINILCKNKISDTNYSIVLSFLQPNKVNNYSYLPPTLYPVFETDRNRITTFLPPTDFYV